MRQINVGMDVSQAAHQGGVAVYTINLAKQLSNIADIKMFYFYSSLRKAYPGHLNNMKRFRLPPTLFEMLFNRWRNVNIEKFLGPLDVFHSSDWVQPPSKAKKVTTYHDLIPIIYPQWSQSKIVTVHRRRLALVEKEIDMVIAVSQSTKNDLLKVSKIPESKIAVIYEAPTISQTLKTTGEEREKKVKEFKEKYNLPNQFILAIGGVGKRRNLARVKDACKDENLVIAGETLPWLSQNELELLYAAADLLLYPSFYEGFGLPILDAQTCGCPVVTSNISSMPEVAGEGAVLVEPNSLEDIIRGIKEARSARVDLIKKGFENVKKFSWEKSAQETAAVYRRLV